MGLIKEYAGKRPRLGERVYLAETAAIIGDVVLGDDVSVWYNTVLRGDCHSIRVGARATMLDGADVGESAFIGAGALVTPRTVVPPRTLWLGAPARQVRELSAAEVEDLKHFHLNYLGYKEEYFRIDGRWASSR